MLLLVYSIRGLAEPFGPGIHSGCEVAMFTAKLTEVSFAQECFGVHCGKGLKVDPPPHWQLKIGQELGNSFVSQRDEV